MIANPDLTQHPLKAWRVALKLSLDEAGARAGVSGAGWHYWENGLRMPQPAAIDRIVAMTDGLIDANLLNQWFRSAKVAA